MGRFGEIPVTVHISRKGKKLVFGEESFGEWIDSVIRYICSNICMALVCKS